MDTPLVDVLLVDDEPEILSFLQRALRSPRFRIRLADSAEAALERIQESPPHILAVDYWMPGMDGLALLAQVKKSHPQVRSFLVSAESQIPARWGADFVVLQKPFLPTTFRELVEGIAQALYPAP